MATSSSSGQTQDSCHIGKLKVLLIQNLRPSLLNLMNQADIALQQNVDSDSGGAGKSTEENPHRLERTMEDFLNICDQLEELLETMRATERQTALSMKYSPKLVSNNKTDNNQDTQIYADYLTMARNQNKSAMELHDLLSDFVRSKLT